MSVSKWAYTPEKCDGQPCPGDCDHCPKAYEDESDKPTDLISRADAINAFWEDSDIRTAEVRATLKELPSADAVQGEWYQIKDHKVMGEGYMWHCSICDYKVYQDSSADYPSENFCPNCGARMKGGAE